MYRVSEFENACMKSNNKIVIKLIEYIPRTLFVQRVFGLVVQKERLVQVAWNDEGKANVSGEPMPEFDIKLN